MYFTTGRARDPGWLVSSELPSAADSTAAAQPARDIKADEARALRHRLEAFHGRKDPRRWTFAWPHLASADRFIRYAARIAG